MKTQGHHGFEERMSGHGTVKANHATRGAGRMAMGSCAGGAETLNCGVIDGEYDDKAHTAHHNPFLIC